jgi:hypothetical protein
VLNSAAFKSQVERISVYDLTGKLREQYLLDQESVNIGESLPPVFILAAGDEWGNKTGN